MKLTLRELEKLIDEAAYDMAETYNPDESKPVDMICGLFAGKILSKFSKRENNLTTPTSA